MDVTAATVPAHGDGRRVFTHDQRRLPTIAGNLEVQSALQTPEWVQRDAAEQVNLQRHFLAGTFWNFHRHANSAKLQKIAESRYPPKPIIWEGG